jgi:hypothetical protein
MRGVFALVSETLAQDPAYRSVHPRMPAFRVQLAGIAGHGGRFVVGADAGPGMIRFRGAGTAALAGAAYGGTAGEGM